MVFDTGSPDIIFPSEQCTPTNGCTNPVKFDTKKSTTFTSTGLKWPMPLVFGTGIGVGVGSAATPSCDGIIGQDDLTIAGLSVKKQNIGLITKQSPDLFGKSADIQGIFGLAPKGGFRSGRSFLKGLVAQQKIPRAIFSLYLSPKAIGNAELTIGDVDKSRYTGNISYIPVLASDGAWKIQFRRIAVNGQTTTIRAQAAVADSGTSNMIAPSADLKKIYALIDPAIQLIDPAGAWGLPCSKLTTLNATITFLIGEGQYTIPSQELSVGPYPGRPKVGMYKGQEGICQTLINEASRGVPFWIIGGSLMKYYYTVWDMDKLQMGWARTGHSPGEMGLCEGEHDTKCRG